MSEHYYTQMAAKLKMSPMEVSKAIRDTPQVIEDKLNRKSNEVKSGTGKKLTKKDISNNVSKKVGCTLNISKLPLEVLNVILNCANTKSKYKKVEVPEGRLKAPYIKALQEQFNTTLDFDTLNVAYMKELLEAFNNY